MPPPAEITAEATGHYCGMLLAEHDGPKGQILLKGHEAPIWFSSVSDAVAFTRLPEEPRDIAAIYVNEMSGDPDWSQASPGPWIEAHDAFFVIESRGAGGMGAPEAIPFATETAAKEFVAETGGRVVRLDAIPDDYVLGAVQVEGQSPAHVPVGAAQPAADAGHAAGHSGRGASTSKARQ